MGRKGWMPAIDENFGSVIIKYLSGDPDLSQ